MPKPALFSECCGLGALAKFMTRAHREEKRGKQILETKRAAHICDFGTVCVPTHGWWREGLFSRRLDLELEDPESTHRFLLSDACIPSCFGYWGVAVFLREGTPISGLQSTWYVAGLARVSQATSFREGSATKNHDRHFLSPNASAENIYP